MKFRLTHRLLLLFVAAPLSLGMAAQRQEIPITTSSTEAKADIVKGVDLMELLRFSDAVPLLQKAVELDPSCAYAHYCLAQSVTSAVEARRELEKAVSLSGKASEGERLLIQSYAAQMNGDNEGSVKLMKKVVAQYPSDKRAHMVFAGTLYGAQKYKEAAAELQKAIGIDKTYAPAYNLLGYTEMRMHNLPKAEAAFKQYTTMIPDQPNPHDSYGELLLKEGKYDDAITAYSKALSLDPSFSSSELGVAAAYSFKGMQSEARTRLQNLFDTSPDNGWKIQALNGIAATYAEEGHFDKALQELNRAHDIAITDKDPVTTARELDMMGNTALHASTVDVSKGTYLKTKTPEPSRIDQATTYFEDAQRVIHDADLPGEIKSLVAASTMVNNVEIALMKNDLSAAHAIAKKFAQTTGHDTRTQIRGWQHRINGMIAMAEKKYSAAIKDLSQTNLEDPLNLYRLAEAYDAAGNTAKAEQLRKDIWGFNQISYNLALVRPLTRP